MNNMGTLEITTPSEREIAMTRVFDAPRTLVFDCWTKPELLRRWLGIGMLAGWSMAVCEIDLRVGGKYRYVWRGSDGGEMGMGGEYREIVAPELLVCTEEFDESWYPGGALDTMRLIENDGKTTLTTTVLYDSQEARDMVLQSDMKEGVIAGFDTLAELLASMAGAAH